MEANVILIKCLKSKKTLGVRIQKMSDGDWYRTWAFKINENQAKREGYDKNDIKGNLYVTEEYSGCPYCGTNGFVQCNKCHKLTCWNDETTMTCQWCGSVMSNIVEATDKFSVSTNQF